MADAFTPEVGKPAFDMTTNKVVRVMEVWPDRTSVRPPGGGVEREVPTDKLRRPTASELMSPKVASDRALREMFRGIA